MSKRRPLIQSPQICGAFFRRPAPQFHRWYAIFAAHMKNVLSLTKATSILSSTTRSCLVPLPGRPCSLNATLFHTATTTLSQTPTSDQKSQTLASSQSNMYTYSFILRYYYREGWGEGSGGRKFFSIFFLAIIFISQKGHRERERASSEERKWVIAGCHFH